MGVDAKEERCGAEPQGKKGQLDEMAVQTQLLGGTHTQGSGAGHGFPSSLQSLLVLTQPVALQAQ